jgi:putative phosphoesterase
MIKIGILSDTHGHLDERLLPFFSQCDEIWHAGDIGSLTVLNTLNQLKPLVAVFGNIDDHTMRTRVPVEQRHEREGLDIWMIHIGGYPGHYDRRIRDRLYEDPPGLFISGHSHILKVMNDKQLGLLHINPGAAGNHGLHRVKTAVRFDIIQGRVTDLQILELERKKR